MSNTIEKFESTDTFYRDTDFRKFRVGTCHGLWRARPDAYEVLAVKNVQKGNGHFKQAMEWFRQSADRDGVKVRLLECWNPWLAYKCWKLGWRRKGLNWEK